MLRAQELFGESSLSIMFHVAWFAYSTVHPEEAAAHLAAGTANPVAHAVFSDFKQVRRGRWGGYMTMSIG